MQDSLLVDQNKQTRTQLETAGQRTQQAMLDMSPQKMAATSCSEAHAGSYPLLGA